MDFLEDPRLRQRWNQITQTAETATENAAANIWSFQQEYINPCLGALSEHVDQCTSVCLGDREERARRQRERERERAEYSFDFYDDWARDEGYAGYQSGGGGGIGVSSFFGAWQSDDWDRLLVGSGASRRYGDGVVNEPPRKKKAMSYGTRRRSTEEDPTVIPSTQPIGFLGKLPFKIGGTLRYKPSAADLQDHPFRHSTGDNGNAGERQALLATEEDTEEEQSGMENHEEYFQGTEQPLPTRSRRNTVGSRATSGSYRSRGDLFPSDGEGDEDAVPLGDEFSVDFDRRSDDRSSHRTRSTKGKYPAGDIITRTVSRSTVASGYSNLSPQGPHASMSLSSTPDMYGSVQSLDDLRRDEERLEREEELAISRKRKAAMQLAHDRGLQKTRDGKRAEVTEDVVFVEVQKGKRPAIVRGGDYRAAERTVEVTGEDQRTGAAKIPAVETTPAVLVAPTVETSPAVKTAPDMEIAPAVVAAPTVETAPAENDPSDMKILPSVEIAPIMTHQDPVPFSETVTNPEMVAHQGNDAEQGEESTVTESVTAKPTTEESTPEEQITTETANSTEKTVESQEVVIVTSVVRRTEFEIQKEVPSGFVPARLPRFN